jgi:hypothetical protein
LIKLAKEIVVLIVREKDDQITIEILNSIIGLFSNYLVKPGATSKDIEYFIVKGGLSLITKLIIERNHLPLKLSQNS